MKIKAIELLDNNVERLFKLNINSINYKRLINWTIVTFITSAHAKTSFRMG